MSCYSRPELLRRGAGRYPQPIALLARLGGATNAMKARASELACCWM